MVIHSKAQKTICMFMSCHQIAGQIYDINITIKSQNSGKIQINENYIEQEIMSKLH